MEKIQAKESSKINHILHRTNRKKMARNKQRHSARIKNGKVWLQELPWMQVNQQIKWMKQDKGKRMPSFLFDILYLISFIPNTSLRKLQSEKITRSKNAQGEQFWQQTDTYPNVEIAGSLNQWPNFRFVQVSLLVVVGSSKIGNHTPAETSVINTQEKQNTINTLAVSKNGVAGGSAN